MRNIVVNEHGLFTKPFLPVAMNLCICILSSNKEGSTSLSAVYSPGFWLIGRESHGAEGASVGFGWEQCSETNLAKIMWEQLESTDPRIGALTEIDHT
ncbi:hypothetical protein SCA6_019203 [Theobroma cacao]